MKLVAAILIGSLVAGVQMPASAASQMRAQAPDFNVSPLTRSDVDTYVSVMRAVIERLNTVSGEQREALNLVKAMNEGRRIWLSNAAHLLNSTLRELSVIDERIAEERGVRARYVAVRWGIRNRLGIPNGHQEQRPVCGRGGGCGRSPTPLQVTLMNRERAARAADRDLVEGYRSEIETLNRQFIGMTSIQWR